jgi:endonuclease/exonuclease/phosphatase family metal-dependent hydrolase
MKRLMAPIVALATLTACTASSTSSASTDAPVSLRVGTLNMEYGGEVIDFDKVTEAALALDADVLAVQEPWGHVPRLAEDMGYPYYDTRRHIVSRLPLLDPPGSPAEYTYVEVSPGRVVAFGTVHLSSSAYGPNRTRRGDPAAEVIAGEEKTRVPEIAPVAEALAAVAAQGTPTFLAGDFNSPSHLDWTEATVGSRPHVIYPLAWPVTVTLEQQGFRDSFRDVHPDPVTDPGLTWPAARPRSKDSWNPGPTAPADRIDYVFATGPSTTTDSQVLTEDAVTPWPTDHRGLVSTFAVTPSPTPVLVSPERRLWEQGDQIGVTSVSDASSARLEVRSADGKPAASIDVESGAEQHLTFESSAWPAGAYEVALLDAAGAVQASSPVWIAETGAGPILTVDRSIAEGDPIDVAWSNAPGNRFDWIGIYRRGADPNIAYYLVWTYTGATIEGSATLDETSEGGFPLPPGKYTAMLLVDDAYEAVATADFEIT